MPSTTMDFPAPTVSGQLVTVDRMANSPILVQRALRTLVQQRLIGDRILTGRIDVTGTGAALIEVSEGIFSDQNPAAVSPLGEYQNTTDTPGSITPLQPIKWGLAFDISDKMMRHNRIDILRRRIVKMANTLVKNSDTVTLAAVASAVTQTQAGTATWGGASATPFLDVMMALAQVDTLNLGYYPDTVVLTPTKFAQLLGSPNTLANVPREDRANLQATGNMTQIAGLTILKTTNMPSGWLGMVLDSSMLGSQEFEDLGEGYTGTPGQLESKVFPLERVDGRRVQARIVKAPAVQEPNSAVRLTGI